MNNWTCFVNALLSGLRSYLAGDSSGPIQARYPAGCDVMPAYVQSCLRAVLPAEWTVQHMWESERFPAAEVFSRLLLNQGEVDVWLHTTSSRVVDPVQYARDFAARSTESCFSRLEDLHLLQGDWFFGIVMEGPAEAVYGTDVWSAPDAIGRLDPGTREGGDRTEAFVVPQKCRLVGVVTDNPDFMPALEAAGLLLPYSPRSLVPPSYRPMALEFEPEVWDVAAQFDPDWANNSNQQPPKEGIPL